MKGWKVETLRDIAEILDGLDPDDEAWNKPLFIESSMGEYGETEAVTVSSVGGALVIYGD